MEKEITNLIGKNGVFARIGECADRLMSRFEKHGKDEIFFDILNELYSKIKRFIDYGWTTKEEVNSYLMRNNYKLTIK